MAMTDIAKTYLFGSPTNPNVTASATTLNSTDDWVAFTFYWPGGDLTKVSAVFTAVSGSPVVTAQLFNVDLTDGGSSPVNTASAIGSAIGSGTITANTPVIFDGIGQAALSAGVYAIRFIFTSGTSANLLQGYSGVGPVFPMRVTVTDGGAQTKGQPQTIMPMSLGNSAGWLNIAGFNGAAINASTSYQLSSNPDEYGLWFTNPWPVSIRISGLMVPNVATTFPDLRVAYYSGSLVSPSQDFTVTIDRDAAITTIAGSLALEFSTKQTLAAGASAGIGLRATSAHNFGIIYKDFKTGFEALMDSWWGQDAIMFTREGDTGALTGITYQTPYIYPIIDGIDPGSGGTTRAFMLGGA